MHLVTKLQKTILSGVRCLLYAVSAGTCRVLAYSTFPLFEWFGFGSIKWPLLLKSQPFSTYLCKDFALDILILEIITCTSKI